jgi:hypothetical protein
LNRSDIPVPGEQGTGRIQLRASFNIKTSQPWRTVDGLAVSMETIEISDGTTNTVFFSEAIPIAPSGDGGNGVLIGDDSREAATQAFFSQGVLTGFVPGQTLRVTLFNPPSLESETGTETQPRANGHIKIFDRSGIVIAQSDELAIPPGESRSFDFNRDDLASPGEPGTNRHQVRVKPFFEFGSEPGVLVSFEIVDNSTGKTEVLSGHQCLVFFLGGIPDS